MSNNKSQISPIPPEAYGDRFVKFISGLTMTKEEIDREVQAVDQMDDSTTGTHRQPSWPISRRSTDKVVEKAEKQAHQTEKAGAHEEPTKDRTLSSVRSPSAERGGGAGATLPVVEEDGEGCSREESIRDEKSQSRTPSTADQPPAVPAKDQPSSEAKLPSIPNFNRLSMGLGSSGTASAIHE